MLRELIAQLGYNLEKLDPNELTIVTYNEDTHDLTLNQIGISINIGYLGLFYLPKKKFRLGVLTQRGLSLLRQSVNQIISTTDIDNQKIIPIPKKLETDWMTILKTNALNYPVITNKFIYVNITNKFLTKYLCKFFNANSKALYRAVTKKLN